MVAPVGPTLAIASERPAAASSAAWTTEASGVPRTLATGSSSLVIEVGAAISSTPLTPSRPPSSSGSPNTRSAIPSAAASLAPATITSAPCSAPWPSRATVVIAS